MAAEPSFTSSRSDRVLTWLATAAGGLTFAFLVLPVLVIALSAFSPDPYPQFPPHEISLRWFRELAASPDWRDALVNSLVLLLIVTPLTMVLAIGAAYGLARLDSPYLQGLQAFILSPLMIPQVVLGISLLYVFSAAGMAGTMTGLAIGHMIVALPYAVRTVGVSLASMDKRLESASMNLGAGRLYTFFHVTLPLIRPGIIAGAVFAAITSFGEVSVSVFLNAPAITTIPVRIFIYVDQTFDPAVNAVSIIFIALAVITLVVIEKTSNLRKIV